MRAAPAIACLLLVSVTPLEPGPNGYPPARREATFLDLGDARVPDPYQWLENGESDEVKRWSDTQDRIAREHLAAIPGVQGLTDRLEGLLDWEAYTGPILPRYRGTRVYYLRREKARRDPLLAWKETPEGPERVLLRPGTWPYERGVEILALYPSPDGRYLALEFRKKPKDASG